MIIFNASITQRRNTNKIGILLKELELKITPSAIKTQHLPNLTNKSYIATIESHIANVTSEAIPQTTTISYKISS